MSQFDPEVVDVEHFLEVLEVDFVDYGGGEVIRFACPFGNHDGEDFAAAMNVETTAWFCHKCHAKGNAIHFAERFLEVTPLQAIRLLKEAYAPGYINPDARHTEDEVRKILAAKESRRPQVILDEVEILRFAVDWDEAARAKTVGEGHPATDYILDRGFPPGTLNDWEFGYDVHTDRVTFAVRDHKARLVGFKGRAYNNRQPKYLVFGDRQGKVPYYKFPCFQVSEVVFGLHRSHGHIIACEGELNAVALHQVGYQGVAINGSYLSERHAKLIRERAETVTVFMDSDKAGHDATLQVVEALKDFLPVRVVPEHEGDPASMSSDEIQETILAATGYASLMCARVSDT